MFSDNTNMISNGSLILYHEIEHPSKTYSVGVIRTTNMKDDLIDNLIEGIENDFINSICITVNYLNIPATNPYHLEFPIVNAYKDSNDFVVETYLDDKDPFGHGLHAFDYEIVCWSMSYYNIIYKIDNVHK